MKGSYFHFKSNLVGEEKIFLYYEIKNRRYIGGFIVCLNLGHGGAIYGTLCDSLSTTYKSGLLNTRYYIRLNTRYCIR